MSVAIAPHSKARTPLTEENAFTLTEGQQTPLSPNPPMPCDPLGPQPEAGVPHTWDLDVINGNHFIQLHQKPLCEGGQICYEEAGILLGKFLEEIE